MNARNYWMALLLPSLLIACLLSGCGSRPSTESLAIKPPTISWGKAGEQPVNVWDTADWIIMSRAHYEGTCK